MSDQSLPVETPDHSQASLGEQQYQALKQRIINQAGQEKVDRLDKQFQDQDLIELTIYLTKCMNIQNNVWWHPISKALFSYPPDGDTVGMALAHYCRKGGDPEYFTNGAGAPGNCSVM